jgi:hypothetical protein
VKADRAGVIRRDAGAEADDVLLAQGGLQGLV